MRVNGKPHRSIRWSPRDGATYVIDQRWLPHEFRIASLQTVEEHAAAITQMWVRGAPLIGATAAYGLAMAMDDDPSDNSLASAWEYLHATRPTAINLRWALDRVFARVLPLAKPKRAAAALMVAHQIAEEDVSINARIGEQGLKLIERAARSKAPGEPVQILTHCNAGWLATVDWGTATSPIYHAHGANIPVHVWVDETRPRNQGALTAWELGQEGVAHTYITDNAGGHLLQRGQVDLVITGTDRTTRKGDVCNKIGTYLKALAAADNGVPFYVALPSPTIDWAVQDGRSEIPIEERPVQEVTHVQGLTSGGRAEMQLTPKGTGVSNPAFDVTPARLITGLITERGICPATEAGLAGLFPDRA